MPRLPQAHRTETERGNGCDGLDDAGALLGGEQSMAGKFAGILAVGVVSGGFLTTVLGMGFRSARGSRRRPQGLGVAAAAHRSYGGGAGSRWGFSSAPIVERGRARV